MESKHILFTLKVVNIIQNAVLNVLKQSDREKYSSVWHGGRGALMRAACARPIEHNSFDLSACSLNPIYS